MCARSQTTSASSNRLASRSTAHGNIRPTRPIARVRAWSATSPPGHGPLLLWHKLHSLSGIVPIGAFLIEHILSNVEALNGPLAYAEQVVSSTACRWSASWSGSSSSSHSPSTPSTASSSPCAARANVNVYPWAGNWGTSPSASPASSPSRTSFSTSGGSASPASAAGASRRGLRQGPGTSCIIPGCSPSTHRHDRDLLALRLRHLALRRQVGHHSRRQAPASASATSAPPSEPCCSPSWAWPASMPSSATASSPTLQHPAHNRASHSQSAF